MLANYATNPDMYFDPDLTSTEELKQRYLSKIIENYEDKVVLLVFNGKEINYEYESCTLMFQ